MKFSLNKFRGSHCPWMCARGRWKILLNNFRGSWCIRENYVPRNLSAIWDHACYYYYHNTNLFQSQTVILIVLSQSPRALQSFRIDMSNCFHLKSTWSRYKAIETINILIQKQAIDADYRCFYEQQFPLILYTTCRCNVKHLISTDPEQTALLHNAEVVRTTTVLYRLKLTEHKITKTRRSDIVPDQE